MSARFRPLTYYLRDVAGLTFSQFLENHNHPVLLWSKPVEWAGKIEFQFETAIVDFSSDQPPRLPAQTASQAAETLVIEVRKQTGRAPANCICVGRSANNDIIFRHRTVSRLHAYFFKKPGEDSYEIVDNRSTNSSKVNNRRLNAYQNQVLVNEDQIEFGPCIQMMYLTPEGFYDLLQRIAAHQFSERSEVGIFK